MDYQEFKGKTVEDAITEACEFFMITSDRLDYEIVENGSNGLFGIGAKQAVIRARVLEKAEKSEKPEKKVKSEKPEKSERTEKNTKSERNEKKEKSSKNESSDEKKSAEKKERDLSGIDGEKVKADADKFLKEVLGAMNMEVTTKLEYYEAEGELYVELSGAEMGVLIGKRGQTLDSLQYLTSLVVNKGTSCYIRVKIDTEDYRRRRKETLENLAKNMASKAKRTKKTVSLEPMNPYERRVIHSALQGDKYVTTHSEGEEPYRRVVINPKRY